MNIQFVYFGKRGGGVNDLTSLLNAINSTEVNIFSLNSISIENKVESVRANIYFDFLKFPNSIWGYFFYLISFKWHSIFNVLKKNKPQHIIITMFHPLNIFIFLYKIFSFNKVKIYYFLHNDNSIQTFNKYIDKIIRLQDILFCIFSNKLFLLSENVLKYAKNHTLLKYKHMNLIGFGVYYNSNPIVHDLDFYLTKPIKFIFFGKILPYKGLDNLLQALDLLNKEKFNFKCFIIGEGHLNYNNKSDNITIINEWVEDDNLKNYINMSHFSIFPYISCSQSGALSTAISNNIPVLVSNIPVLNDYVDKNNFGFLIKDISPTSIASVIKEIDNKRKNLFNFHKEIIIYNQNNSTWSDVWSKIYINLI